MQYIYNKVFIKQPIQPHTHQYTTPFKYYYSKAYFYFTSVFACYRIFNNDRIIENCTYVSLMYG